MKIHRNVKRRFLVVIICPLWSGFLYSSAAAQEWSQLVRGSWVANGAAQAGDIILADRNAGCEIVVAEKENFAVKQAAAFLVGDIEKINGYKPPIIATPSGRRVAIHLVTLGNGDVPEQIAQAKLRHKWESYQILTNENAVWLVGANFRGTAFAVYTLSERLVRTLLSNRVALAA